MDTRQVKNVGVIGYSGNPKETPVKEIAELCLKLGEELGKRYNVFTGGRDGVMELVSKGVKSVGGFCVGVLPWEGEDSIVLTCSDERV
jgi:uncharacterized protein (TIGR00725 family)